MAKPSLYAVIIILIIQFGWILWETNQANNFGFASKTLWDWMDLLIVPLALALGAFLLNFSQKNTELKIAKEKQEDAALGAYYDRMADLLLTHNLRETNKENETRSVARARTLAVLNRLNGERKGQALKFLYESQLIERKKEIICLKGADLRQASLKEAILSDVDLNETNLSEADLFEADLFRADLFRVKLDRADLRNANLTGAVLIGSDLSKANLTGAILMSADMRETNLRGANLKGTNLRLANLQGAENYKNKQLLQAKTLEEAIMPDGKIFEDWLREVDPDASIELQKLRDELIDREFIIPD